MDSLGWIDRFNVLDVTLAIVSLIIVGTLIHTSISRRSHLGKAYGLPPGPKPLPLIGNLLDLPKDHDSIRWAKHKDIYGPISSVTVFGQTLIIVNDAGIAIDLFEKRSNIYSDRPTLTFGGKMCGWCFTSVFLRYGDDCKMHRRYTYQLMGSYKAVDRYHDLITSQTRALLCSIYRSPNNLASHIKFFTAAITLRLLYGYEVMTKKKDPLVALAERIGHEFSDATLAGRWIVDTIPALQYVPSWFPGASFKRIAKRYRSSGREFIERPFKFVKQEMGNGSALKSFTADLIEMNAADAEKDHLIQNLTASLYLAGTDTTVSTIHTFFLAMMLNPDVQKKAQDEIDSIVGVHRLPVIEDRPNLPYTNAVVKEALRWNPVVPLGFPHVPSQDDIYEGYLIPKGAVIMPNIWLFTHNPEHFKDPGEFRPERFLKTGEHIPEPDPYNLVFGFGRRECPGKILADVELFLAIASSLSAFDIRRPEDDSGRVIEENYEFSSTGLLSHPKEFACQVRPRSGGIVDLLNNIEETTHAEAGHAEAGHADKLFGMSYSN